MQPAPALNKDTPIRYDIECIHEAEAKGTFSLWARPGPLLHNILHPNFPNINIFLYLLYPCLSSSLLSSPFFLPFPLSLLPFFIFLPFFLVSFLHFIPLSLSTYSLPFTLLSFPSFSLSPLYSLFKNNSLPLTLLSFPSLFSLLFIYSL